MVIYSVTLDSIIENIKIMCFSLCIVKPEIYEKEPIGSVN